MTAHVKKNVPKSVTSKPPKVIAAGEFKARCLQLMDEVAATGQSIVVTKRGKPVVQINPKPAEEPFLSLFGLTKGWMTLHGDIMKPIDAEWEMDERNL